MPNWCHNTLTVTGDPDLVASFVEAVKPKQETLRADFAAWKDVRQEKLHTSFEEWAEAVIAHQPLSFPSLVPPSTSESADDWYEWRLENWGCKWDASFSGPMGAMVAPGGDVKATVEAQGVQAVQGAAVYKFDTPWSPPLPFVEKASAIYPDLELTLQFGEMGNGYAGRHRFIAGLAVAQEELEVEEVLAREEMWF